MPPRPVGAILALALAACGSGQDELVTVAGGQLDLWCDGGEGPTVVFLAALGGDHSLVPIAERTGREANACFYDRPGDGETDAPEVTRTAMSDAADLHELLDVADIPTPVVLVAHSYGGLISIVAAAEHPDEIAGLVLIDASHPEQEERTNAILTDAQVEILAAEFARFPYVDFLASLDQAADAYETFPDIPLTVITATRGMTDPCMEGMPCEAMQTVWLEVQDEYAALTPDARHVLADTGHYVHDDDPELVVAEIKAILEHIGQSP
ncbi:MAG: alpha/beta hydrolase [Chloroflexi bacterium]|nr:alpha/beta hydrolase [Chloroflexota bacterium]